MRTCCTVFVVSAIVFSAPFAWAQPPQGRGGFGGGLFLLGQESVQKELGLSEDQIKQVDEHLAKQRESFSGLRDLDREERQQKLAEAEKANQAALASVLNEDQLNRFKQIGLQQRGGQALADPQVSAALGLTDEQKSRLGEIQTTARDEMRSLFQGAADGDRQEIRKKFQEAQAAINTKLLGVLTPEQQTKWKEMTGKPFTGEIRRSFRGGNQGGAGPEGNRRRNRDATSTGAAIPANRPAAAAGLFRLTSFRADDADDDSGDDDNGDDDAKKSDAKRKKKPGAKKSKAKKPGAAKAKGHSPEARRRGRGGPAGFGRSEFSREHGTDRDRAWARVARAMREREHGSRRPSMARRGTGPGFAHGSHRDHGPRMAWGGRPPFGGPGHHPRFAGLQHPRGHRSPAFGFAQGRRPGGYGHARFAGHRGPMMADHRGPDRHHQDTMAQSGGFRGHHEREMAHRPGHHGHPHHAMHARHHHGPRASFAGHRGHGPMHMAGFKGHRPHGPDMGKHHQRHGDDSPSHARRHRDRDDRDGKGNRDRGRDRDNDDRDDG